MVNKAVPNEVFLLHETIIPVMTSSDNNLINPILKLLVLKINASNSKLFYHRINSVFYVNVKSK